MTYADLMVLDREKLTQVLCIFPESASRLRKKVIRLALRRHLIDAKRSLFKRQQQEEEEAEAVRRRASFVEHLCGASTSNEEGGDVGERSFSASMERQRQSLKGRRQSRLAVLSRSSSSLNAKRSSRKNKVAENESTCRSSAVELALLLEDKQISQSEYGDQDQVAQNMAHVETMAMLAEIKEELLCLRKDVNALQEAAATGAESSRLAGGGNGGKQADGGMSGAAGGADGAAVVHGVLARALSSGSAVESGASPPVLNTRALARARVHRRCKAATTAATAFRPTGGERQAPLEPPLSDGEQQHA